MKVITWTCISIQALQIGYSLIMCMAFIGCQNWALTHLQFSTFNYENGMLIDKSRTIITLEQFNNAEKTALVILELICLPSTNIYQ
jgi:hypothetical protein